MFIKKTPIIFISLLLVVLIAVPIMLSVTGSAENQKCIELPIVMYHHISDSEKRWGSYVISTAEFESDLKYLRDEGYTSISTEQLIQWADGNGVLPEKPVMITFDDGFESTYVYAMPLLEKYGMKAVVSVVGAVTEQYTKNPDHNVGYSYMDWNEVKKLDKGNVFEVQCHTYNMHSLSPRKGCNKMKGESETNYEKALNEDFTLFQTKFTNVTGHSSNVLALPFGTFCKSTIEIAKKNGFEVIFLCAEKVNKLTGNKNELLSLGRYNRPHGKTSESFFERWNEK